MVRTCSSRTMELHRRPSVLIGKKTWVGSRCFLCLLVMDAAITVGLKWLPTSFCMVSTGRTPTCSLPVSYTHLDVYKRQAGAYRPRPFTQDCTSSSEGLERKRTPSCQSPVPASSASSVPLSPRPELAEVQKGITVLPVKSLASTKPLTGQAAMPHQIGN